MSPPPHPRTAPGGLVQIPATSPQSRCALASRLELRDTLPTKETRGKQGGKRGGTGEDQVGDLRGRSGNGAAKRSRASVKRSIRPTRATALAQLRSVGRTGAR